MVAMWVRGRTEEAMDQDVDWEATAAKVKQAAAKVSRVLAKALGVGLVALIGSCAYTHWGIVRPLAKEAPRAPEVQFVKSLAPLVCDAIELSQLAGVRVKGPLQGYRAYEHWRALAQNLHVHALRLPDDDETSHELRGEIVRLAAFFDQLTARQLILHKDQVRGEVERRLDTLADAMETYARNVVKVRSEQFPGLGLLVDAPDTIRGAALLDLVLQPEVEAALNDPELERAKKCLDAWDV
jgi:hypothetical protein